ncbi:MAG TPA: thiamine phosphate synthase, partial [Ruminiclostridium sp.]|nr:thiamine phosphate synthase [Ruminiclostridium sp.]
MLICVTNRKLCRDDFLNRVAQLAKGQPRAIILREKDLSLEDYESLAVQVKDICDAAGVPLIVNKYITAAMKLGIPDVHVSMQDFRSHGESLHSFSRVWVSVHSADEAKEASEAGAFALIAGHIYETDCKKGVLPRGLSFLKEVCSSVSIPVFAIGGITKDRACETAA